MSKLTFYSFSNFGKFQDDSDQGYGTVFFERLSDAKKEAQSIFEHWINEGDSIESEAPYSDEKFVFEKCVVETHGGMKWYLVKALNRDLAIPSEEIGVMKWSKERGVYYERTKNANI